MYIDYYKHSNCQLTKEEHMYKHSDYLLLNSPFLSYGLEMTGGLLK